MRPSRNFLIGCTVLGAACLGPWAAPATPATLECSLRELGRLGYLIGGQGDGSAWRQAYRARRAGGEEIWIRLVDDGRNPAWLDVRVTSWDQFPQRRDLVGDMRPFVLWEWSGQGQEDIRTIRDACEGPQSRNAVVGRP